MYVPDEHFDAAVRFGWWKPEWAPSDREPMDPDRLCDEWIMDANIARRCIRVAGEHTAHNAGNGVTWQPVGAEGEMA